MTELSKHKSLIVSCENKMEKLETQLYNFIEESSHKTKFLKNIIRDYRKRYAGSIPLHEQESFTTKVLKLEEDKAKIEKYLGETVEYRDILILEKQRSEEKFKEIKELQQTLKGSKESTKLIEWHKKMQDLRFQTNQLIWDKEKLKEMLASKQKFIDKLESEKRNYEEDKNSLIQEFEKCEIDWEKTEKTLLTKLMKLQNELRIIKNSCEICQSEPKVPEHGTLEKSQTFIKVLELKKCKIDSGLKFYKSEVDKLKDRITSLELENEKNCEEIINLKQQKEYLVNKQKDVLEVEEIKKIIFETIDEEARLKANESETINNKNNQMQKFFNTAFDDLNNRLNQKEEIILNNEIVIKKMKQNEIFLKEKHLNELEDLKKQMEEKREVASNVVKNYIQEALDISKQPINLKKNDIFDSLVNFQAKLIDDFKETINLYEKENSKLLKTQNGCQKEFTNYRIQTEKKICNYEYIQKSSGLLIAELKNKIKKISDENFVKNQENIKLASINLNNQQIISGLKNSLDQEKNIYKENQLQLNKKKDRIENLEERI